MSNTRYLEFDSTYRNRNEYPEPADFIIPMASSASATGLTANEALDPVSLSASIKTWTGDAFEANASTITFNQNFFGIDQTRAKIENVQTTTGGVIVILKQISLAPPSPPPGPGPGAQGIFQKIENYYSGAILTVYSGAPNPRYRIISCEPISAGIDTVLPGPPTYASRLKIFLNTSSLTAALGTPVSIQDPSDIDGLPPITTASVYTPLNTRIFLPAGPNRGNAFPNHIVYNQTKDEYRPIKYYSAITHIMTLDTSGITTKSSGPIVDTSVPPLPHWEIGDTYSIRKNYVKEKITLEIPQNPPGTFINNRSSFRLTTPTNINLVNSFLETQYHRYFPTAAISSVTPTTMITFAAAFPIPNNYWAGSTIYVWDTVSQEFPQKRVISSSTPTTITVASPFYWTSAVLPANLRCWIKFPTESRKIYKFASISGILEANTTTTQLYLPSNASDVREEYTNLYIDINGGAETCIITNYTVSKDSLGNVTSRVATVSPASAAAAPGITFSINSGVVNPPFPFPITGDEITPPPAGLKRKHLILPFSHDNFTPFVYTGSITSQQEMVCYEVDLVNLVLPNRELAVGAGGFISYYPYVYVLLQNVSASGANLRNIIYSNNPNSTNVLFRCAITDIANPNTSSFIKVDCDGATQTVKFKPNDNLRFAVFLPNGEVFKTVLIDNFAPKITNPLAQISGFFFNYQIIIKYMDIQDKLIYQLHV